MSLTVDMARALASDRRDLCFLGKFQKASGYLYAWTGMHDLSYDGQTWKGVGRILGLSTIDRGDALSFRTQTFTLNGLDPQVVADLDESVRGRTAQLWLAARDRQGKIIKDPLLLKDLVQDTLEWSLSEDGKTVSVTLNCFEALKHLGRPTGKKWSHESQMERFAGDTGMYYLQRNAQVGLYGIDWRQG
jgi:hypothetical protein